MKILITESQLKGDFSIDYSFKNDKGRAQIFYQNNSLKNALTWMGYKSIDEVDDLDDMKWIRREAKKAFSPEILLLTWYATEKKSGFANYTFQKIFDIAKKHNCYYLRIWNPNQTTRSIMAYFTKKGYVRPDERYKQGISVDEHYYRYFLLKRPDNTLTENAFKDETGKFIVYDDGEYRISVDDPEDAQYIVLWHKEIIKGKTYWGKRGALSAYISPSTYKDVDGKFLSIKAIDIEKPHRGRGYGSKMYEMLIKYARKDLKGIVSYLPNRVNKKEIPKIYKKYNSEIKNDYEFIYFNR